MTCTKKSLHGAFPSRTKTQKKDEVEEERKEERKRKEKQTSLGFLSYLQTTITDQGNRHDSDERLKQRWRHMQGLRGFGAKEWTRTLFLLDTRA